MTKQTPAGDGGMTVLGFLAMVAIVVVAILVLGVGLLWLQPWDTDRDGDGDAVGAYCDLQCEPAPCQSCGDIDVSGTIDVNVDVSGTIVVEHTGTVVVSHTGTVAVTIVTTPEVTTTTTGGTSPTTQPPTTTTPTTSPVNHNPSISVSPEFDAKWATSPDGEACFTFTASVGDVDGDSLTVSWSTGGSGVSTNVCREVGNAWQISATVSDGRGGTASDGSTFNVMARPPG